MKINPDASIEAEENISFNFSGSFSYACRDIPEGQWNLSNVSVTENNLPVPFTAFPHNGGTRIRWNYSALNEKRSFKISYRLENAVTSHDDVPELYWKVWGEGWGVRAQEVYGWIELPKEVEDPKQPKALLKSEQLFLLLSCHLKNMLFKNPVLACRA